MRFEMAKWYLDCITREGAAAIAYSARMRWAGLCLGYGALLLARPGEPVRQFQSLHPGCLAAGDQSIEWRHAHLKFQGRWLGGQGHDPVCLYQDPHGRIDWHCRSANARARVELPDGASLEGLGYAEELRLTLPPWRLPFDVLRWGRFVSDTGDRHHVWIDWRGGLDQRWIWSERGPLSGEVVGESGLATPEGRLELNCERTLRDAPLAGSLLGGASALGRLLPGGLGRSTEAKWLSRGRLLLNQDSTNGWAIHEVVRWR